METICIHVKKIDIVIINYLKKNGYTYNSSFPFILLLKNDMIYVDAYPDKPSNINLMDNEQFIRLINEEYKQKYDSWVGKDVVCIKEFHPVRVGDVRKIKKFISEYSRGPIFDIKDFGIASLLDDYYPFDIYWKLSETQSTSQYQVGDYVFVNHDGPKVSTISQKCSGHVLKLTEVNHDYYTTDYADETLYCGGIYKDEIRPATAQEINDLYKPEIKPKFSFGDKVLLKTDNSEKMISSIKGRLNGIIYYALSEYKPYYREDDLILANNKFKPGDKIVGRSKSGENIASRGNPLGVEGMYFVADKVEYLDDGCVKLWSKGSYWRCDIKDISLLVEQTKPQPPTDPQPTTILEPIFKTNSLWRVTDEGSEYNTIIEITQTDSTHAYYKRVDSNFTSNFHMNSAFAKKLVPFSEVEPYINKNSIPSTSENIFKAVTTVTTEPLLILKDETSFLMSEVKPVSTININLLT